MPVSLMETEPHSTERLSRTSPDRKWPYALAKAALSVVHRRLILQMRINISRPITFAASHNACDDSRKWSLRAKRRNYSPAFFGLGSKAWQFWALS